MIRNRYVSIPLDERLVVEWPMGFYLLGELLAYEVALHGLDEWPELIHARREPYGWRLVFVWRDQDPGVS
jgi:hypothetical protein